MKAAAAEPQLCLFGAAPDTGNLGVAALGLATLQGVAAAFGPVQWTIFDHGRGMRRDAEVRRCGAVLSRRYHRPENLWQMRVRERLGLRGPAGLDAVRSATAVLDLSGGDSFTDAYGDWRFRSMVLPKLIALEAGIPLVLLPQFYGPFRRERHRRTAADIVSRSALAWARDERGFRALQELLGDRFDPTRHLLGVDLALGLTAGSPPPLPPLPPGPSGQLVGLNVSGLLFHDALKTGDVIRADYRSIVLGLARRLLERTGVHLLLVPHVLTPNGHPECDRDGNRWLMAQLGPAHAQRVTELTGELDAPTVKAAIASLDWFCGARMHACIAAISSGVPCAGLAYSDKMAGVFAAAGASGRVLDLRHGAADQVVEELWAAWGERDRDRERLAARRPEQEQAQRAQLHTLAAFLRSCPEPHAVRR